MSSFSLKLTTGGVFILSVLFLLFPIFSIELQVLQYTHGIWIYPLDDAYIHIAVAKNLALNHIWSATGYGFQSVSSSILYPILLSASYILFGVNPLIPLIVNLIAAFSLLYTMQKWLDRQGTSKLQQLLILVAVNFLTPLPVMVVLGMEHTLQILISFLFIYGFCDWLAQIEKDDKRLMMPWSLCIWSVLVTGIRFEGIFLIILGCLFLLWKKRPRPAISLGILGALPIVLFGIYSMNRGSYFLPNSVLLKSASVPQRISDLPDYLFKGLFDKLYYSDPSRGQVATENLLIILPLLYLYFFRVAEKPTNWRYICLFLIGATLLHLCLSNTGWFYRYEAYLVGSSVLLIGLLLSKEPRKNFPDMRTTSGWVKTGVFLLLSIPLGLRGYYGLKNSVPACHDIYNQNYQMGEFLHKYYDSSAVAINDLGAVSYLAHGNSLDLWGIADISVARSKREGYYSAKFLDSLIKQRRVGFAAIFDRLYPPRLLRKWKKIATWHIDNLIVAGDPNLNFYAVDTLMAEELKKNLIAFQVRLPPEVIVVYY
jgi:hypothetical protein